MKKISSFILIFTLVIGLASGLALPVGAKSEKKDDSVLQQTKNYYTQSKKTLTDWQETLICAATGIAGNVETFIPEIPEDAKAADYAKRILVLLALNKDPKNDDGKDITAELLSKQQDDGSFDGNIYSTIYSIEALQASKTTFESGKAVEYILSQQLDDGGFAFAGAKNGDVDTTAMTLTALSGFMSDEKVNTAVSSSVGFIKSKQNENGGFTVFGKDNSNTLATVITALVDIGQNPESEDWNGMVNSLLRFKNDDGSFRFIEDADKESNDLATVQVFIALESCRFGASVYKTLATNGSLTVKINWEDFKPLIITFLVLCALSIIFWIFILKKKPRTKTLEETKLDPELLPKLEEDQNEIINQDEKEDGTEKE